MLKLSGYIGVLTVFCAAIIWADTHYVSLDGTNDATGTYTNWVGAATQIQWAVEAAAVGETVLVSNGTYNLTNHIVIAKNITLKSLNGRTVTSINGNYRNTTNRCIYVSTGPATIDGFAISNGYAYHPDNDTVNRGGGVYLKDGTVMNCIVRGNYAGRRGGGIYTCGDTQNIISNCVIESNEGGWGAGGIYMSGAVAAPHYIVNCTISRNTGNVGCGGGIFAYTDITNTIIRNCVFSYNLCQGGVSAGNGGGGYDANAGIVEGCTFFGNRVTGNNGGGGGLFMRGGTNNANVKNCIIYSNTAETCGANWDIYGDYTSSVFFANNCTTPTNDMLGSGNIINYPMFVDWAKTNLRLKANSPCVNTGTNQSWMTNGVDLDGRIRIRYGRVDMGAYERIYDGAIYSVR